MTLVDPRSEAKVHSKYRSSIADGRTGWNRSLSDQMRWLRVKQKPYMTQAQLAYLCNTSISTISEFETGEATNLKLSTLRKYARALGCEVYIKLVSKPSRAKGAYLLEGPALPPMPKLVRKATELGRWQQAEYKRLMGKIYRPPSRRKTGSRRHGTEGDGSTEPQGTKTASRS
jgi:transcriptional regulator with XRE-family HTH domain